MPINSSIKQNDFTCCQASKKLAELAKTPWNLSEEGALTKKRLEEFTQSGSGFDLYYGTEQVTKEVMDQLQALAVETGAQKKMRSMQEGAVLNKIEGYESEDRMVLHTAVRCLNPETAPSTEAKKAAELAQKERVKLKNFLQKNGDRFDHFVLIGIGGSDLGPRAIYHSLEAYKQKGKTVHFIANVDPDDAANALDGLDLSKTLVAVVSKSGTTLETLTNEFIVKKCFEKEGLQQKDHFVAVTGEGSPMDDPEKYLSSFYIWDFVGGRYSSSSMVGGVMLAFALGYDNYEAFLKGSDEVDKSVYSDDLQNNLPLTLALLGIWNRNFLKHQTFGVMAYSQPLFRFPAHLQQCDMESNGKQTDKMGNFVNFDTGSIVWGEPGTNSQHSFFQLLHQGTNKVPVEFIGFRKCQRNFDQKVVGTSSQEKLLSNLFAQSLALALGSKSNNPNKTFKGNRPNHILMGDQLTPKSVGALLAICEHRIAYQGFIWNINSFDQEGVQLGKVLAGNFLKLFSKEATPNEFPLEEAYLKVSKCLNL